MLKSGCMIEIPSISIHGDIMITIYSINMYQQIYDWQIYSGNHHDWNPLSFAKNLISEIDQSPFVESKKGQTSTVDISLRFAASPQVKDQRLVLTASHDGTAKIWRADDGKCAFGERSWSAWSANYLELELGEKLSVILPGWKSESPVG